MFGAASGGGLFGAAPASGGLFGAAPAASSGGGLFGAAPAGGGLFGAPAAAAPADPNAMERDFKNIGQQFAQAYYQAYDSRNFQSLLSFYEAHSLFTFEDEDIQGATPIVTKLSQLGFQSVQHSVTKCKCQPVPGAADKVMVNVVGSMMVNGSQNVKFSENFLLSKKPPQTPGWFVLNNTFSVIQ